MRAASPEPSLFSHMHKLGVHTAHSISQCSDAPGHACSLARAFTALAHVQNGRRYGIFFQSMLGRALACVQSCQGLNCSRTCTKWEYIWHIFQSMFRGDLVCTSLARAFIALAHTQNGCVYGIFISQCSYKPKHAFSLTRALATLAHAQNGRT